MERLRHPNYGIDAPGLVRMFLLCGECATMAAVISAGFLGAHAFWAGLSLAVSVIAALYLRGMGSFMMYESRIGKVRGRETMLDLVDWRGDEQVLDVGCGRGLLLVGAAKRLTTGTATGIDIWQAEDQSGNGPDAAVANAAVEGVGDRIAIKTGDMRELPFAAETFDVVMSHWVVHNLSLKPDRQLALAEMHRVLRPGGTLIVTDIDHRDAYAASLREMAFHCVRLVVRPMRDALLNAVSFGSFRPATVTGQKAG